MEFPVLTGLSVGYTIILMFGEAAFIVDINAYLDFPGTWLAEQVRFSNPKQCFLQYFTNIS